MSEVRFTIPDQRTIVFRQGEHRIDVLYPSGKTVPGREVTDMETMFVERIAALESELAAVRKENAELRVVIHLLLDSVDYTAGACRVNEMVGAVLPQQIIDRARAALAARE